MHILVTFIQIFDTYLAHEICTGLSFFSKLLSKSLVGSLFFKGARPKEKTTYAPSQCQDEKQNST